MQGLHAYPYASVPSRPPTASIPLHPRLFSLRSIKDTQLLLMPLVSAWRNSDATSRTETRTCINRRHVIEWRFDIPSHLSSAALFCSCCRVSAEQHAIKLLLYSERRPLCPVRSGWLDLTKKNLKRSLSGFAGANWTLRSFRLSLPQNSGFRAVIIRGSAAQHCRILAFLPFPVVPIMA